MIRLFARHAGRHLPRPGSMLQPARFTDEPDDRLRTVRLQPVDEPEDDWGEPDDDDGRCVHCGAEIGHYNGCTEDPDAMCLCHLCMEDQAVTTEEDCPFHGSDAPHRPSWRERLARPLSRLIDATARGMAWLLDDDWDGGLDDRDIADPFGTQDLPRPGERGAPSHGVTSSAGKTAPRPGPGQPGLLRRFADWLAGLEDWDDDPEDGEKEPAQARGCMAELCRYWPGEGCMRGVMPCGEDGYVTDDTLTGTDIIDYSAPLRGEAPVMAGHYDVPRPGEQPTVNGPEGATGVNAQAGPGHPGTCRECGLFDGVHFSTCVFADGACPNCGRPGFDGGVCGRCGWGYGWQPASEAAVSAVYGPGELPLTAPVPSDDTVTDWAPRVCAGRNPWVQPAPAPPLPLWVQECLGAPTVGAALADIWAMAQVRALAGAS